MTGCLSPSRQLRVLSEALEAYGTAPYQHPYRPQPSVPLSRAYSLGYGEGQHGLRLVKPRMGLHIAGIARLHGLGWGPGSWSDLEHESGAVLNLIKDDDPDDHQTVITPEILDILAETGVPVRAYLLTPYESREPIQTTVFAVRLGEGDVSEGELLRKLASVVDLPVRVRRFSS